MKATYLLLGLSLSAMTVAAHAQNAQPPQPLPAVAAASPVASMDPADIIVTAQKRAERLKDVPITVTALSAATLTRNGITSVRELQSVVSGLSFGGQGTISQPAIRGVSSNLSSAGSENPNALYVDGVYQIDQTALNVALPDIQEIEVLKGPQGTLFGRNTTGGAILITTKPPSFTPAGDFTVEPGYYTGSGTSRGSARVDSRAFLTGPIVPGLLAASISGGYDWTDGYLTDAATGGRIGRIAKANGRAKLLLTPASGLKITFAGFYNDDNDHGQQGGTPYHNLSVGNFFPGSIVAMQPYYVAQSPNFLLAKVKQYGGSVTGEYTADVGTFKSLTAIEKTIVHNLASISGAEGSANCVDFFACINFDFNVSERTISQEFNFASRKFGPLSFVAGLFFFDDRGVSIGRVQPQVIPGGLLVQNTRVHSDAYAAYGEANYNLTDQLTLIAGLRYNHEPHDDIAGSTPGGLPNDITIRKTFNSVTPRVSLRYAVDSDLNVYATFSEGERSGLTGATNVGTTPLFLPVAPEKLYSYEAGVKYGRSGLSFDASFFYYDYKNKQEESFTGTSIEEINTGKVRIYGTDVDASARLSSDFRLNANLTLIRDAKFLNFPYASGSSTTFTPACDGFCGINFSATGQRLIRTPKVTANATLNYSRDISIGHFDASATVSYSTTVYHDLTQVIRQPAYATLNVQSGVLLRDSGVRLGAFARNLTNKAYIVNGLTSGSGFIAGYAPPREIGLSLNYSF